RDDGAGNVSAMSGARVQPREAQERLAEATAPDLAALPGYSRQRHRQERQVGRCAYRRIAIGQAGQQQRIL
ncbi:hypothetical protein, partial [Stutzerimonas stutzeri]|uniref:hypothetical protein n=1 Tax=Stutzerimonas stutzeri TaxID=316 RepID=UPI0021098E96